MAAPSAPMPTPATSPPAAVVALANKLAKLPFMADFDGEAALASFKEKNPGVATGLCSAAQLKEVFIALGYDKAPEAPAPPEGAETGEGGEEKKDDGPPPPPPAMSQFAEEAFALVEAHAAPKPSGSLPVATLLPLLLICKAGYGESALRFALKCAAVDETASLKEAPLWTALRAAASGPLSEAARNNLRRAWRTAAKFEPPPLEASSEEGAEPPPPVVIAPADVAVMVDDFVAKLAEDAALANAYTREVAVPIEKPAEAAPAE